MDPVNIRVSGGEAGKLSSQIPTHENMYENFIVSTNREYQTQIKELQTKLHEVEREREEFETDNEKIETSQRYMRGILKNYFLIDTYNKKIKDELWPILTGMTTTAIALRLSLGIVPIITLVIVVCEQWPLLLCCIATFIVLFLGVYEYTIGMPTAELQHLFEITKMEIDTIKKTNELLPDLFDHL